VTRPEATYEPYSLPYLSSDQYRWGLLGLSLPAEHGIEGRKVPSHAMGERVEECKGRRGCRSQC
jgi:hypothetical protein